ncbi:peptide ABC transporter permease [Methylobacterium variabile]|uniref:Peptide ABC transporter permease n=1 Tax=Methylobacterium variabile TaxID=298794 RepID=A0A0J6T5Y5_9HYPH|nr:ABC transporter permease [Methylobacterium variabile]KMO40968.1 peptide ABC transporter permease [Methylobacterium variabile]
MKVVAFRLLGALPILLGVVIVTFVLVRALPGDPATYYASSPSAGPDEIRAVRQQLGLDRGWLEQFLIYVRALAHGQLGQSLLTGQPVLEDFRRLLPATIELAALGFAMGVGVALPLGILAAFHRGSALDQACRAVSSTTAAMPGFFFGLLLIYLLYYLAGVAPEPIGRLPGFDIPPTRVTGFMTVDALIEGDPGLAWRAFCKMLLPAASMAIFAVAPLLRMMRGAMIDALDSDYVMTARAFGLTRARILISYALPNAMLPVLATMGMVLSTMLGANVMIEKLFAWPGIGAYAINALLGVDYAPVQAFVLIVAVMFVILTLVIDLLTAAIDPRVDVNG